MNIPDYVLRLNLFVNPYINLHNIYCKYALNTKQRTLNPFLGSGWNPQNYMDVAIVLWKLHNPNQPFSTIPPVWHTDGETDGRTADRI